MKRTLIHNAMIINEGTCTQGSLVIEGDRIAEVLTNGKPLSAPCDETIDATGCYLIPGVIDDHVHFREPGMTHKANIFSESRAAAAGGVTSIMDMPNTKPATVTMDALHEKMDLLNEKCLVNHACYYGATDKNFMDFARLPKVGVAGIKLFMGATTGSIQVSTYRGLLNVLTATDRLIAAHCESQQIIEENTKLIQKLYINDEIPVNKHPMIRSEEACYESSKQLIKMAQKAGTRLHLLHLSTIREINLLEKKTPLAEKKITSEVTVGHLFFNAADHKEKGGLIKVNPAIKTTNHRTALRKAMINGTIDVVATDHAPHLLSEKEGGALTAASGMPSIQFSLLTMLKLMDDKKNPFGIETIVERMCHNPATIFHIPNRGFIREGYKADLVLIRKQEEPWTLTRDMVLSPCGWSPFEGEKYNWKVERTFVNGRLAYQNGEIDDAVRGEELEFNV